MADLGTLTPEQLTKALSIEQRNRLIFDVVLTSMEKGEVSSLAELLVNVPKLAFTTGKPGEYIAAKNATITPDSIKQITIYTGDRISGNGDGMRYFKLIHLEDNIPQAHIPKKGEDPVAAAIRRAKDAGFRAAAWQETDAMGKVKTYDGGKSDIIFSFPGFTGKEAAAFLAIRSGELDPKVYAVPAFIKESVHIAWPKKENVGVAHAAGNSMGTASVETAQKYFIVAEIPCTPHTAAEPYGGSMVLRLINEDLQCSGLLSQAIAASLPEGKGALLNTGAEMITNPNMHVENSYRNAMLALPDKDGKRKILSLSQVASDWKLSPRFNLLNNRMTGKQWHIDITEMPNILPNPDKLNLFTADYKHMNAISVAALIKENADESLRLAAKNKIVMEADPPPSTPVHGLPVILGKPPEVNGRKPP